MLARELDKFDSFFAFLLKWLPGRNLHAAVDVVDDASVWQTFAKDSSFNAISFAY